MSGSWRAAASTTFGIAVLLASSALARAQIPTDGKWHYGISPYGWLVGLSGTVGIGPVASNVDLDPSDILDMLKFGIMGYAEARHGPWVFSADGIYANLGAGHVIAVRGDTGRLEYSQSETIIQPMVGYAKAGPTWNVDFVGGFRYWNLGATLDVDRTTRPSNSRSNSRSWADVTVGVRGRWVPYEKIRVAGAYDGGGGGSNGTWQLYGSLGYEAWTRWTFSAAYRALSVNYHRQSFLFDTVTKGFLIGVTYGFQ